MIPIILGEIIYNPMGGDGRFQGVVSELAIERILRPGMRCIDVGANYGYYSILMAEAVGPDGFVLACEPNLLLSRTYLPDNLALCGKRTTAVLQDTPTASPWRGPRRYPKMLGPGVRLVFGWTRLSNYYGLG